MMCDPKLHFVKMESKEYVLKDSVCLNYATGVPEVKGDINGEFYDYFKIMVSACD